MTEKRPGIKPTWFSRYPQGRPSPKRHRCQLQRRYPSTSKWSNQVHPRFRYWWPDSCCCWISGAPRPSLSDSRFCRSSSWCIPPRNRMEILPRRELVILGAKKGAFTLNTGIHVTFAKHVWFLHKQHSATCFAWASINPAMR